MIYKSLIHNLTFIITALSLTSCGRFHKTLCGEPKGLEKKFVDSLNLKYESILVGEPYCMYPGYFRVDLKTDVDTMTINYLDSVIRTRPIYHEVLFYDKKGNMVKGNNGSM